MKYTDTINSKITFIVVLYTEEIGIQPVFLIVLNKNKSIIGNPVGRVILCYGNVYN